MYTLENMAKESLENRQYIKAIELFRRAYFERPTDGLAIKLADTLMRNGQFIECNETLLNALYRFPKSTNLFNKLISSVNFCPSDDQVKFLQSLCTDDTDKLNKLNSYLYLRPQTPKYFNEISLEMKKCKDDHERRNIFNNAIRSYSINLSDSFILSEDTECSEKIPIFTFWDKDTPNEIIRNAETWKNISSESSYIYNEEMAHTFISKYLDGDTLKAFENSHHPAMKSDIFRLCKVYIDGGMYVDADEAAIKDPSILWNARKNLNAKRLIVVDVVARQSYCHNYLINADPNDKLIERALNNAVKLSRNGIEKGKIWLSTGPGNLTNSFCNLAIENPSNISETIFISSLAFRKFFVIREAEYKNDISKNWRNF